MRMLSGFVILSVALRIIGYETGASLKFIHNFTLCRFDAIAFGGIAAIWLRSAACSMDDWRKRSWQLILAGIAGTLFLRLIFGEQSTVVGYTFIAEGFTGLLGLALISDTKESVFGRILTFSWLRGIGRISYGLYLLHMPLFLLVDGFARSHAFVPFVSCEEPVLWSVRVFIGSRCGLDLVADFREADSPSEKTLSFGVQHALAQSG
jgi:peptidoglycan/LPS O-acetylase OafA/YrhL